MRKEKLEGGNGMGGPGRDLLTCCRVGDIQPLSGEVKQLLRMDKPSDRSRRIVLHPWWVTITFPSQIKNALLNIALRPREVNALTRFAF